MILKNGLVMCDDFTLRKKDVRIENGYVLKDFPNVKPDAGDFYKGRRVYNSIKRTLKYQGKEKIIRANNIVDSGKIDMIKRRAAELGMSCRDYIYSENVTEIEKKYGCKIVSSSYIINYGSYLD